MKKKILSVLLSVIMVLSLLPAQVFAADEITVYVTISDKGSIPVNQDGTVMAEVPIKIPDGSTVSEVIKNLHDIYCPGGYEINIKGWVDKLWNDTISPKYIAINEVSLSDTANKVIARAGDHITAALIQDTSSYSDKFVSFDNYTKTVPKGVDFTLSLTGYTTNNEEIPLDNISVGTVTESGLIDQKRTNSGLVSLAFQETGTYYISAQGAVKDKIYNWTTNKFEEIDCPIIAPICVVTVTEQGEYPDKTEPLGPRASYVGLNGSVLFEGKSSNFYQVKNDGSISKNAYFNPDIRKYNANIETNANQVTLSYGTLIYLMPKECELTKSNCEVFIKGNNIPFLSTIIGNEDSKWISYQEFARALSQKEITLSEKETTILFLYTRASNPQESYQVEFTIVKEAPAPTPNVDVMNHVLEYHTESESKTIHSDFSVFDFMFQGITAFNRNATLGSFGSYMIFSFDKEIKDTPNHPCGIDFIVYGNNFGYAPEPGSVSVSKDGTNWCTLAGSMHYEQTTKTNVDATLFGNTKFPALQIAGKTKDGRPTVESLEPVYGYADVHKCSGLPNAEGDYEVTGIPGEIYGTDHKNAIGDGFDLAWAVDDTGKPVQIDEIKYIRIQNAVDCSYAFGPVSTDIGTITRAKEEQSSVGVTEGLSSLIVNGKDLVKETPNSSLYGGKNRYYEVDLKDNQASMLELSAKGGDSDHIVVNNAIFTGSASTKLLLNSDGSRMVRVVVQNGQKEPVIYTIRVNGGGDPAKNAILSTMTLTPGDVQKSPDAQNTVSFEVAQNVSSMKLKLKTLNPNANIQISGDGLSAPMSVKSEVQSEALALKTGINTFQIAITATDNVTVKQYTLKVTRAESKPTSKVITVSFKLIGDVDHSKGGSHQEPVWIDTTSVEIPTGSTVKYVTDLMLYNCGISFSNPGNYITKIVDPKSGTALAEFTNGPNSGWMYRLNGKIANSAYADRILASGDTLIWSFTDDYTKEKNYESYEPWKGNAVLPPQTDAQTIKPELTVKNGTASTTVKESQISDALAAAKKSGASEIAISLETKETVKRTEIFLPAASVQSVAGSSNLLLTVNAPQGTLQLPSELLSNLAKQNGGGELKLSMETRSASELNLQGVNLEGAGIVEVKFTSGNTPITQFNGSQLTLRIPVSKDQRFVAGKRYHAITLSGDNTREDTWADIVQQNGNLLAELKTKHLSTFIVTNQLVNRFTDVEEKAWYHDAVSYVASKGIMDGVGTDTFEPNSSMTRAMLTTVLYRLEGKPNVKGENPYKDVAPDAWYTNAVLWATQNKIVSGYGNGRFGTNESITREELATMLRNYAKLKNNSLSKSNDLSGYTDAKDISSWALEAMKWANAEGILSGRENKTLAPKGTATRAEVSALLMRFTTSMTH